MMPLQIGHAINALLDAVNFQGNRYDITAIHAYPERLEVTSHLRNAEGNLYLDPMTEQAAETTAEYDVAVNLERKTR